MRIYHWNKDKVYINQTDARVDPKEPDKYLFPARSTKIAIPETIPDNYVPMIIEDKSKHRTEWEWELVENYQGKAVTNVKTYEVRIWNKTGKLDPDWTTQSRPENSIWSKAKNKWVASKQLKHSALINDISKKRDEIFNNIRWRIERYQSEKRLGKTPTDNIKAIDLYADKLRNLDQLKGYPEDFTWPTPPWKE